jgi:hypothetical protein
VLWVLLFVAIAVGGLLVLGRLALGLWRRTRGLLAEVEVMAVRAGELVDLLAQVGVEVGAGVRASGVQTADGTRSELDHDPAWPGTVETYDDRGATAPGKKEP